MEFDLKQKTKKVFEAEWEREEILILIRNVCQLSVDEAKEVIWELTYNPRNALFNLTFLDYDMPREKAMVIRAEIINQYREVNDELDYQQYNQSQEDEGEAIKRLRRQAKGDAVIMDAIMSKVNSSWLGGYNLEKCKRFLRDHQEERRYSAFKEMGFNKKEIKFLIEYAEVIADLLEKRQRDEEAF